ncbi:hypothetical protein SKTS_24730 [Sulfurimicrobium lacus]|uniref:histidine kinase n=2 Tax=Sulfurimicrobium lacus TaxID=2715678 RepID=A0A6F8VER4_9PROT|nr:hypothetical protein SKTS_24730 [Sulfurimicrobium lacus]
MISLSRMFGIAPVRKFAPYIPLLGFIVISLVFAVTSFQAFRQIEDVIVKDKIQDLDAVADLKARQINGWRQQQIRRGEGFSNGSLLPEQFGLWIEQGMPHEGKEKILRFLAGTQRVNGYRSITLFDKDGVARLTTMPGEQQDADDVAMAQAAITSRRVFLSDIHMGGAELSRVKIDLVAPLVSLEGNGSRVMGSAVFELDPRDFLYPLMLAWPYPSPSAESLLVRRDGDDVQVLSELRHRPWAALSRRQPLTNTRVPGVLAIQGETSSIDSIDYRGVQVVSAMRKVPGTSWFIVSKVDKGEFLAPVARLKQWSMALGLALALIGGLVVYFWLRAYQVRYRYLKEQHDAAVEREALIRHFELLTKHANDMIMVADDTTRIIEANERMLDTFGYTRDELLAMQVADLRDPEQDLSYVNVRLAELMAKGELRVEESVRRKDGSTFPVEISARVIEVQGKVYLQGILRDITERRCSDDALRRSEAMLKESQKMAHIGTWEMDLLNNVLTWSDENYRIFEIEQTQFGATYEAFLAAVHPDDREMVDKAYSDSVKDRTPYSIVHRLLFPGQRVKYVREWCETFYDQNGKPLRSIGTTQDITEHNKAEQEYQAILQATTDGFLVVDAYEGRFLDANIAYSRMTGYSVEELENMRIDDVEALESPEHVLQHNMALRESGSALFETRHRRKDGGIIDVEVSAHFLDIRGGRFIVFIRDITDRKQAERKIKRLNSLYSAISRANEAIVRINDRDLLLNEICQIAVESGQFKLAWIGLVDDATQTLKVTASSGPARDYLDGILVSIDADKPEGRGPVGMSIRDNREYVCEDFFKDPRTRPWQENARKYGLHSSASCPLGAEGRIVGALTVYSDEVGYFDQELTNLLTSLSRDISIALDNFAREERRREAEETLRLSEEKFRTLVGNLPQKVFVKDANSVYTACNTLFAADLGIKPEEIVGKTDYDFFSEELAEKYITDDSRIISSGEASSFEELYVQHGQERFVHTTKAPLKDEQGEILGVIGVFWDITDIKLAEKKLFESEQRFRTMADNAPIIIWMANIDKGKMYTGCGFFNKQWHDFTGLTLEESQGYNWMAFIHSDDRGRCLDAYIRAFEETREFRIEYRLRRKDGVYRWIRDAGEPRFTTEGEFLGFIGICVDITDQKLIEEMRAEVEHVGRLNIAGEMASGLAHELSQPLTAASNYLDGCLHRMELAEWDREKLRKAVRLAYLQTERAGGIISHLKAFIRKQGPERAMLDINDLIEDSVDFLAQDISHQSIRVIPHFSVLPPVWVNKIEIEQVLLNLMKNSIDAMASLPRRELHLSTCLIDSGNVLVTVSDTGKGIPEADLERVFNPFQTSKKDGLGLGLAICRSLVENYGGRIWAEQNADSGTEFSFTLPTEPMEAPEEFAN